MSADDVSYGLIAAVRSLKGLQAEVSARLGLRLELPALGLLSTLEQHGGSRLSAVAELLRLDLSSVSRQVATLERDGLVRRERDPHDQRASLLHLSPAGEALLQRVRATRAALLREDLAGWSPADLSAFAAALERFAADTAHRPAGSAPAVPAALLETR